MSKLFEVIGSSQPVDLLADPRGADQIAVPMKPGEGVVPIGTVIYRMSNGVWAPAASGQISTSYQLAVLAETVDTDADMQIAEDAAAYRAGHFIPGKVKLAAGATVTEAHKVVLRLMGILFDVTDLQGEFDNNRYKITYVANNGAATPEPDYLDYAYAGSYTALTNSTTDFTAPATKSFSKWNTQADGSGTDVAAGGSVTLSGNLTLYAVWAS